MCLPKHFVHHLLTPLRKCSDLIDRDHPCELSHFWPPNSPNLNLTEYKMWGINQQRVLPDKSVGCDWFEAASDWGVGWSGTGRYWRCYWPVKSVNICQSYGQIFNKSNKNEQIQFTVSSRKSRWNEGLSWKIDDGWSPWLLTGVADVHRYRNGFCRECRRAVYTSPKSCSKMHKTNH